MKLEIELVPKPCWYSNMRKAMTQKQWDTLRRSVYQQYNYHCAICNAEGEVQCHEIWHYDDENHVQTLKGFVALCLMCHHVKHIGLARTLANKGQLNIDNVIAHFCKVNECYEADFLQYETRVFAQWMARNASEWRTDLGDYTHLVTSTQQKGQRS